MDKVHSVKIALATGNLDKIREIKEIFKGLPVELTPIDFEGPDETGETLEENALLKARYAAERTGFPALADDTGLEVEWLEGEPGVYSARFAGENATYSMNVDKLLRLLQNVPMAQRKARFRCVSVLAAPGGKYISVEGSVHGSILTKRRGEDGFGYDPVFQPDGFSETFAEMSLKRKNSISHRSIAMRKMKRIVYEMLNHGTSRDGFSPFFSGSSDNHD